MVGVGILSLIAVIGIIARSYFRSDVALDTIPIATAQRGTLTLNIVESGTLQAVQSVTLASEIKSDRAKIAKIAPEGTYVQAGELVIEFDKAPFEDELRKLRFDITQSEAAIVEATENLKLQQAKNDADLKEAQANIVAAEAGLKNIEEGEGVIQLRELEMDVERAAAAFEQATQKVADLKEMLESGFITQNELTNAETELKEIASKYEFAKQKHQIFVEFTRPSDIEKARRAARESTEHLQQLREMAERLISLQQANLQKEQANLQGLQEKYKTALDELRKTTIYAPIPGLVIYNDIPASGKARKIQVGDAVWSHQGLISLPDISRMMVETNVREVDIHKVALGQQAQIQVDAYPDAKYTGVVHLIGSLATTEQNQPTATKYFQVQIVLNESDDRLRPGMTARVEIVTDHLEQVLYVPLEGVFEKAGQKVCYVVQGKKAVERPVTVGKFNRDFIVIEQGVTDGEQIYLQDPTTLLMR